MEDKLSRQMTVPCCVRVGMDYSYSDFETDSVLDAEKEAATAANLVS
jgi:hypothetical protein